MTQLNELSAREVVSMIAAREASAEEVTKACLDHIEKREKDVLAFQFLDPELALNQARALDLSPSAGILHGLPLGVKDIIETIDMPTGWGSEIYEGRMTGRDAACVALCRAAGAVMLGKTVTSEFACYSPGKTRNPHDLGRTPGASSMGSAAGVADFMFPVGFGSQTASSIIRPAAHCGTVGYKVTTGTFSLDGVMELCNSLDTLGFLTREIGDVALMRAALLGDSAEMQVRDESDSPRIALVRTKHWPEAEAITREVVESAAKKLSDAGAIVEEPELPEGFDGLTEAHETIMPYEALRGRAFEIRNHREGLTDVFRAFAEEAQAISFGEYVAAQDLAIRCRKGVDDLFDRYDLFLTPSAVGEAIELGGLTGNPMFSRLWTLLHVPLISLPVASGPQGLPIGIQLVGRHGADNKLLADAQWVRDRLA